jgi:alanine racemase
MQDERMGIRTWVEVDRQALKHNYDVFRSMIGENVQLMAIAKSNAYGHCLFDYAKTMSELGVDWLGVDSVTEAMKLRAEGLKTSILILGHTLPERVVDCLKNDIAISLSSFDQIDTLQSVIPAPNQVEDKTPAGIQAIGIDSRLRGNDNSESGNDSEKGGNGNSESGNDNRNVGDDKYNGGNDNMGANDDEQQVLKVHIKIDTGMHRQGFQLSEVDEAFRQIQALENVQVTGIFTHFAAAKNPAFPADTLSQIDKFEKAYEKAKQYFGDGLIRHAAATSGTLLFPQSHYDMVRIGIGLYGLWTSKEAKAYCGDNIELKPALSWKTVVAEVKNVVAGERVSYDFTEKLSRDSKIAILPIGYWNGFRRSLSSVGHVLIRGQKAKVLGRVTMDMIIVDVTNIENVKSGDLVTLIGRDGELVVTADDIAALTETSNYEVVTQLNPLMKRIYLD